MITISPGRIATFAVMSPRLMRSRRRTLYSLPPSATRKIRAALPSAKSVSPPAAIMTSSTVISLRYASVCGLAASPMTRTCSPAGPAKLVTMTVTTGSRMYLTSSFSMSRSSSVGVFPQASRSSINGVVIRPSGRTGTTARRSRSSRAWTSGPASGRRSRRPRPRRSA